jgi:CRP-like cAMP-binding protein
MESVKLRNLSFFEGYSTYELDLLAPYFAEHSFNEGDVIFEQEEHAEFLYLVMEGTVMIRFKPEDGPPMKVAHILVGGVFGWSAVMGNEAYTSGAVTLEECKVLKVRGADLQKLTSKYPNLGKKILDRLAAVISERWQNRQSQVISFLSKCLH